MRTRTTDAGRANEGGAPAVKTWGPFSGRQLTTIICVVVVMAMFPVAAWGIAGTQVFLTDPHNNAHAAINKAGQLSTRGVVTGSVNATPTPPNSSYNAVQLLDQTKGCSPATPLVPAGRALVVTSVSITLKSANTGPVAADLYVGAACTRFVGGVAVPAAGMTQIAPFAAGLPIKAGHRLFVNPQTAATDWMMLVDTNGYLVPSAACTVNGPPSGCF